MLGFKSMKFIGPVRRLITSRFLFALVLFAFVSSLLVGTYNSHAQSSQDNQSNTRQRVIADPTPTPPATKPASTPKPTATPTPEYIPDDGEIERVDVDLVNLNVRVVDRNNRSISDVKPEEFKVFEDGVAQQIMTVTQEEVPISYGIAIDRSASLRNQINKVIEAGQTIVSSNKPGDETFVISFISSDKITLESDFSADKNLLKETLDNFFVEGGQTAVIDGVFLAAEKSAKYKKGDPLSDKRRRALIVVTDGEDRDSKYTEKELYDFLREEDVQIYIIGFVNELDSEKGFIRGSKRDKAVSLINRIATESGGNAYFPTSLNELPGIAQEITKELRTQYVVSYYPSNLTKDGKFRSIRVTVADLKGRDKRIAITRQGRVAALEGAPTNQANTPANKNSKP
jgi:Ca-activated chloride channel family protein